MKKIWKTLKDKKIQVHNPNFKFSKIVINTKLRFDANGKIIE